MLKAIHFADCHLDMENYGPVDPESGHNSRVFDFLDSLDKIIDHAITKEVDVVLFSGDAFRVRDPSPTKRDWFDERIIRLSEKGIQVVLIIGNHDMPSNPFRKPSICAFKTLKLRNIHLSTNPELLNLDTKSGPLQVVTLPYQTAGMLFGREEMKNKSVDEIDRMFLKRMADKVKVFAEQLDPEIPAVLMAHCTVSGSIQGSEKEISLGKEVILPYRALALPEFEYVAMGHIHKYQVIQKEDLPPLVYSGSPNRIDFSESEEDKGFIKLSLEKGNSKFLFEKLKVRDMLTINVDVQEDDPTAEFLAAVKKVSKKISGSIIKPKIHFERHLLPEWDEKKVLKSLKKAFYVLPFEREIRSEGKIENLDVTSQMQPSSALGKHLDRKPKIPQPIKDRMMFKIKELHEKVLAKKSVI